MAHTAATQRASNSTILLRSLRARPRGRPAGPPRRRSAQPHRPRMHGARPTERCGGTSCGAPICNKNNPQCQILHFVTSRARALCVCISSRTRQRHVSDNRWSHSPHCGECDHLLLVLRAFRVEEEMQTKNSNLLAGRHRQHEGRLPHRCASSRASDGTRPSSCITATASEAVDPSTPTAHPSLTVSVVDVFGVQSVSVKSEGSV